MRLLLLTVIITWRLCAQPALSVVWGQEWSYNTFHPGATSNGDTWGWNVPCSSTQFTGLNDGTGIAGEANSNMAFYSLNSTFDTLTLVNKMTNFGTATQKGLGQCNATSSHKTAGMACIGTDLFWIEGCQDSAATPNFAQVNVNVLKSSDSGATWCRPQDLACNANGSLPTTSMWSGSSLMGYAVPVYYPSGSGTIDGNNSNLNMINIDGSFTGIWATQVSNANMAGSGWATAANYTAWIGGTSFGAFGSAVKVQCIVGTAAARDCVLGRDFGPSHIGMVYLPDLTSYLMITDNNGVQMLWSGPHFYGPFTLISVAPIPRFGSNVPVAEHFSGILGNSIVKISSSPVMYRMNLAYDGPSSQIALGYYAFFRKEIIVSGPPDNLARSNPYVGPLAGQFPANNCWALWVFDTKDNSPIIKDYCPNGLHPIVVSPSTSETTYTPVMTQYGMASTDMTLQQYFGMGPNGWFVNLPTFPAVTDFGMVVMARQRGTPTTNSVLIGGDNTGTSSGLIELFRSGAGGQMRLAVCSSTFSTCASNLDTVAAVTDGNWFVILATRVGSTISLYTYTTQNSPVTTTFSNSIPSFAENLGKFKNSINSTNWGSYEVAFGGFINGTVTAVDRTRIMTFAKRIGDLRGIPITY